MGHNWFRNGFVIESGKTHITGDFFGTRVSYAYLWFTDTISGHRIYYAAGYGGQYLLVAPDLDFVVLCTQTGVNPSIRNITL